MLLGPIKLIPSFSGVTRGTDVRFKRSVAIWGVVIASVLCAFVALSGETLLGRYRISIDAVRIAGGLVLMISALLAIFQKAQPPSPGTGTPTAVQLASLAGCRSGHCATGPVCNLACEYCFCLVKKAMFGQGLRGKRSSVHASEQVDPTRCHVGPRDDFDAGRQPLPLSCRGDHPTPVESEVFHALPQSGQGIVVYSGAKFDLDRQNTLPLADKQVDLGSGVCPPEEYLGVDQSTSGDRRQFFNHKAFEGCATPVPRRQLLRSAQTGQEMQQSSVPHIELRTLGESLLHIYMKGLEAPDHIGTLQYVKVSSHRMGRHGKGTCKVGDVQKISVDMGQHGPQRAQSSCGQPQTKGGQVPLKEGGDVGTEPFTSCARVSKTMDRWKASPEPAISSPRGTCQFRSEERGKFQQSYTPGECLGNRAHEGGARRSQEEETTLSFRMINNMAQGRKYLRKSLSFVDGNRAGVHVEKSFQIVSQHGEVGWTFEIEAGPFWEGVARKRALAALARPHKENGRKRPEEKVKTIGAQSVDIFHTLQFGIKGSKMQDIKS